MNFKKFGLAVLAASVFTFIACDDSASASGDETKGETQQITSSESNDGGDKTAASSSSEESVNNSESKNNAGSGTTDENPGTVKRILAQKRLNRIRNLRPQALLVMKGELLFRIRASIIWII